MRFLLALIVLVLSVPTLVHPASVLAEDGIPDNCNYPYGAYYRSQVFPRYEPQNRRLLLVDWTTGAEVGVLATNLDDTLIRAWSADCRYLAVATGTSESRATAVYDTVDLRYVGEVPDARIVPHPITWGPNDFLMVEGRNGAVLWNVPANIQYSLDVGFNTTTYRNFSRLRWDTEHQQLTANLANGGRIVYDLTTGQSTVAAYSQAGELVLGGERFACTPNRYNERGGSGSYSLPHLYYARSGGVLSLATGWNTSLQTLQTLEANVSPGTIQELGWSVNCRYVAAALASATLDDAYDMVIWDVLEQKRVGTFPDAHEINHRLTWDTAEKNVLVETRNGAYLWNLQTGAHILVNDQVQAPSPTCRYDDCQPISFHHVYWDAGSQQMLGVPVQTPNAIVAYDVNTGAEAARYMVNGTAEPVQFITSNNSRLLLAWANGRATLWDRASGAVTTFSLSGEYTDFSLRQSASISTDDHFLAVQGDTLRVWDLTHMAENSTPAYEYANLRNFGADFYFVNGDTIVAGYNGTYRINVVTGQVFGEQGTVTIDPNAQPVQTFSALPGTSGSGAEAAGEQPQCALAVRYDRNTRQVMVHDLTLNTQRVIESDLNQVRNLLLSPDCHTIYADVQRLNTSLPYDETPGDENYRYDKQNELIFWDADDGERIATLDIPSYYNYSHIWWNPDGNRALVRTNYNAYSLLVADEHKIMPLRFQDTDQGTLPPALDSYWDYRRGLVLIAGYGEVFAIDMQTGQERLRFPVREGTRGGCAHIRYNSGCGMDVSGAWVFVYGDESLSTWNMETLAHASVPVVTPGRRMFGALISPDGRYLVVSRAAVRVWDLAHLPADFAARTPIANYDVGADDVLSVRFIDNITLEVVTQTLDSTATTRYDVVTGNRLAGAEGAHLQSGTVGE